MNRKTNMDYYQSRALRERELARMSANDKVALIHLEMAEQYETIVANSQNAGSQVEVSMPAMRFGGR